MKMCNCTTNWTPRGLCLGFLLDSQRRISGSSSAPTLSQSYHSLDILIWPKLASCMHGCNSNVLTMCNYSEKLTSLGTQQHAHTPCIYAQLILTNDRFLYPSPKLRNKFAVCFHLSFSLHLFSPFPRHVSVGFTMIASTVEGWRLFLIKAECHFISSSFFNLFKALCIMAVSSLMFGTLPIKYRLQI